MLGDELAVGDEQVGGNIVTDRELVVTRLHEVLPGLDDIQELCHGGHLIGHGRGGKVDAVAGQEVDVLRRHRDSGRAASLDAETIEEACGVSGVEKGFDAVVVGSSSFGVDVGVYMTALWGQLMLAYGVRGELGFGKNVRPTMIPSFSTRAMLFPKSSRMRTAA